ncbi:hypothetical protein GCM10007383_33480 [Arenibacter certesii]|uniref:Uncharacterized protein n=1 Tax=Arenibacter certesii TaxID=228955 RepID=A0A918J483_9FLAO|nr:hypothetical protein GCM10007383_33480 [Arenibacter certesii]
MLCYLYLCSIPNTVVNDYTDTSVDMVLKANELHIDANKMCFIANTYNFKIRHNPKTIAV